MLGIALMNSSCEYNSPRIEFRATENLDRAVRGNSESERKLIFILKDKVKISLEFRPFLSIS